ncbi:MAG: OsmC family protein [Betaproteobacteria bacterium]
MTIESRLHRAHGALTTLANGRHAWASDVSREVGSTDSAPSPHDLLDSALAACTTLTLELYIRRRQLPVTDLRVTVDHVETKGADGRVHYALARSVHIDGPVTDEERAHLLEIANKCPIHRLLEGEITVATALAAPGAA